MEAAMGNRNGPREDAQWYMTHRDFGELLTGEQIREHMAEQSLSNAAGRVPERAP